MSESIKVVNIQEKLNQIKRYWEPRIAGEINDSFVKLAKLKGEFIWHHHDSEDELFWVISGHLQIHLRERIIHINPGEFVIIPHGVEHKPVAENEVLVLLLEPRSTINTGNVQDERTTTDSWI